MSIIRLQGEAEARKGVYYQLDSADAPIGVGGMGQVFKGICVDTKTNSSRPVAIKFMYDDLPPASIERARREASIQLRNDNLVEMLGFIETESRSQSGEITFACLFPALHKSESMAPVRPGVLALGQVMVALE